MKVQLTLKVPEKLQLYGLYVYYVVHIFDFGILRVHAPSVYSFENGLDKYWKRALIKFKYDAKPPGFDPANLKRGQNLELNTEA